MVNRVAAAPMSDGEFHMFAELIRKHCGLHFSKDTRFLLERRIERRMHERALTSFAAYHYELRSDVAPGELARLIDEITTNETYFFRERRQLRALMTEILPEALLQRRGRGTPINLWSAGCASGEEPYSIVILAREAGMDPSRDLRVYASDISVRMLQRARQQTYRESAFRETERVLRDRYFEEKDGCWKTHSMSLIGKRRFPRSGMAPKKNPPPVISRMPFALAIRMRLPGSSAIAPAFATPLANTGANCGSAALDAS